MKAAEDIDMRMAAAELGVTPQLLANVLNRRNLHLSSDPAALRRLEPSRETLTVAALAVRRRAKVHALDDGIQRELTELATFLEQEAGR
jgi:hypothetical protein